MIDLSLRTLLITLLLLMLFGIYVGVLLYGENGYFALRRLDAELSQVQQEIRYYRHTNQILQKHYFELKELEPSL